MNKTLNSRADANEALAAQRLAAEKHPQAFLEVYDARVRADYSPPNHGIDDEKARAWMWGWNIRNNEPDRPTDDIDAEYEDHEQMYEHVYSWNNAVRNHPELYYQGYGARNAGLPSDTPAEIIAADIADGDRNRHRQKAWLYGWGVRERELNPPVKPICPLCGA